MRMTKKILSALVLAFLFGCSGSDTYRGLWKATNAIGEKFDITFEAKSLSVKDSTGKVSKYEYTQNSVSIENAVETYGIKLSDGRDYLINFPLPDDETKGVIKDAGGNMIFIIGKGTYVKYEDIYKLN